MGKKKNGENNMEKDLIISEMVDISSKLKSLTKIKSDIYRGIEKFSVAYDHQEENSAHFLAYETNRVIGQLIDLNYITSDYVGMFENAIAELEILNR